MSLTVADDGASSYSCQTQNETTMDDLTTARRYQQPSSEDIFNPYCSGSKFDEAGMSHTTHSTSQTANSSVANENAKTPAVKLKDERRNSDSASPLHPKCRLKPDGNMVDKNLTSFCHMEEPPLKKRSRFVERPGWQLFAICYLVGVQSSLTTGFVNSCYSTLEKLFNFNSKFTGLIEGSFHAAIVLLVIPVSFYGRKGNKPLIMASGAALIAIGAFCYSSAEFFRDRPFSVLNITNSKSYNNGAIMRDSGGFSQAKSLAQGESGCTQSQDAYTSNGTADSQWIKWLFVTGMFLIGVGSTPIQTVAIAYLDQSSSHEENTGWSLGWFNIFHTSYALIRWSTMLLAT